MKYAPIKTVYGLGWVEEWRGEEHPVPWVVRLNGGMTRLYLTNEKIVDTADVDDLTEIFPPLKKRTTKKSKRK